MIRLGASSWWLDPTGEGWVLLEVVGRGRKRFTRRYGPFTAIEHVLQQRAVALPDEVRAGLAELVLATESGNDELEQLPVTDALGKGEPPESPPPPRHGPGRTDHDPHSPE